jgi:hypothetical protein
VVVVVVWLLFFCCYPCHQSYLFLFLHSHPPPILVTVQVWHQSYNYSAAKQLSTVNFIKTSGLWKEVSQFNYSVVNIYTCYINTKQLPHHQTNIFRTVQTFSMFNFFAVWHFVITVLYPHCQTTTNSHKNKRLLYYSCEIRDLKSTYSLKTYNIRRLESKQYETLLFFPPRLGFILH